MKVETTVEERRIESKGLLKNNDRCLHGAQPKCKESCVIIIPADKPLREHPLYEGYNWNTKELTLRD